MLSKNSSVISFQSTSILLIDQTKKLHFWMARFVLGELISMLLFILLCPVIVNAGYLLPPTLFATQVLLSQCHRFRALVLLGRFLDMGPWAVELVPFSGFTVYYDVNELMWNFVVWHISALLSSLQALSVGIFPYVLKLLQTTTPELRQILVFIWTKILALDKVNLEILYRFVLLSHLCWKCTMISSDSSLCQLVGGITFCIEII